MHICEELIMKDRTFLILLAVVMTVGTAATAALMIYGYNLWKEISIVEMISNWGY